MAKSKTATDNEHLEQLNTLTKAKAFLGREFLTWLWYTAESGKERVKVTAPGSRASFELDLWVDDRIVLDGASADSHQHVMKGGDPSHSREAAASLSGGKTVRELKLGLNVKNIGEFSAILHCDELNPRSLKLPAPGSGEGQASAADVPLVHRLRAMETFLAALDGLFARFLSVRVGDNWERDGLSEMREWVKARQKKYLSEGGSGLH